MTRIKAKTTTFQNRRDFEAAVDKAAALQLKLEADIAEHNQRKAAEDKAFKTRVKTAQAKLNEIVTQCESYAAHNREELLGEKQTAETKLAFFGYRKSPGIVKTLNSKWTLGKAVAALKEAGKLAFFGYRKSPGIVKTLNSKWTLGKAVAALKEAGKLACVKVTESLDKQAVKSQLSEPEMARFGLRIDAPEEFGIEAKRAEETPAKKATA